MSRAGWGRLLQALASVAVLYALSRQVDAAQMALLADRIAPLPLLAALGVKILSLGLHELRLWVALPAPRPRKSLKDRTTGPPFPKTHARKRASERASSRAGASRK